MASKAPVDSPTAIMWVTILGNTWLEVSGSAMVFPPLMLTRAFSNASSMTLLPEVFARTWGIRAEPFWPTATRRVREQFPAFTFMAEVYWDMEWTMQKRDTAREQRSERPGEFRHRRLSNEVAEYGSLQQELVDGEPSFGRGVVFLGDHDETDHEASCDIPERLKSVADINHELRGPRQADFSAGKFVKHLGENRNHEDHQDGDDNARHAENRRRINHRGFDLSLQLHRLFDVLGQTGQNGVKETADFAGVDHVDVEIVEYFWMFPQRVGKRVEAVLLRGSRDH